MVDLARDIDSLSNFKRETSRFLKRMKKTGEPMVLTINGKAELIVQDTESYQQLLELAGQVESLEFLRRSLEDVEAGRVKPMRQAVLALGKRK